MSWPSFHNFWFFWTIACSSHLFCKILNFHSYSQNMFNFQPSRFLVLCILFSYKSSQIYQHAFQRLFIECITCDHFAFCKAIGILHKFQMYHGLQQGEINFPFNFITFLISSSSFFFFLIRIRICSFLTLWTASLWGQSYLSIKSWNDA